MEQNSEGRMDVLEKVFTNVSCDKNEEEGSKCLLLTDQKPSNNYSLHTTTSPEDTCCLNCSEDTTSFGWVLADAVSSDKQQARIVTHHTTVLSTDDLLRKLGCLMQYDYGVRMLNAV